MERKKRTPAKKIIFSWIERTPNVWVHPYEMVEFGKQVFDSMFLSHTFHRQMLRMAGEQTNELEKKVDQNGYVMFRKARTDNIKEILKVNPYKEVKKNNNQSLF